MMKQKNRKIKMATAKKHEPELFEIIKMNKFQNKVLRSVARLLGLGRDVYVITVELGDK
jgi:hypothetical protein